VNPDSSAPSSVRVGLADEGWPAVAAARDGLDAEQLLGTLRAVFPAETRTCHWSACLDTISPIGAGLPADLAGWTEGRVWGRQAEVRWRPQSDGNFSALFLGDGELIPEGFSALGAPLRAVPSRDVDGLCLWGRRAADGRYYSSRLSRGLDYAGLETDAAQARIPFRLLLDGAGQVRFVRLALTEEGS
jgi:hypothetical protein